MLRVREGVMVPGHGWQSRLEWHGRWKSNLFLLCCIGLAGFAVGGIVDVVRADRYFLSSLSNHDEDYIWTMAFHLGGELGEFTMSYLALLLCVVLAGGVCLAVRSSPPAKDWSGFGYHRLPMFPAALVAPSLFVLGITFGMVANRRRMEALFERDNVSHILLYSDAPLLEPWYNMASFYPQLVVAVGSGILLIWGLWLLFAIWRRWRTNLWSFTSL